MSETTPNPSPDVSEASIRELLIRTVQLYREEGRNPGPWRDCARLIQLAGRRSEDYHNLYPDLADIYCDVIAGTCSFGEKILDQPDEWLLKRKAWLSKPFFDLLPQYKALQPFVSEAETPHLHKELRTFETLRNQLLVVIDWVLAQRRSQS